MSGEIHFRLPRWLREMIEKEAKESHVTMTDIIKISMLHRILHYNGDFNKETIEDMEFNVRKKVESQK